MAWKKNLFYNINNKRSFQLHAGFHLLQITIDRHANLFFEQFFVTFFLFYLQSDKKN